MIFTWVLLQFLLSSCLLHVIEVSSIEEIVTKPVSLIYFYAPDCQYCQLFDDDFQYLSHIYSENSKFQIIKINGREQKYFKELFDVKLYPTLKLYDHLNKQVITFKDGRLIENLQDFIKKHAEVEPDLTRVKQELNAILLKADVERLQKIGRSVLIAFVRRQDEYWEKYHYPDHFYQSIGRNHPSIEFTVNFFEDGEFELMELYHVSNIPALVLIEGSHIGVYNTLSTNPMSNYMLDANDVEAFLSDFHSKKEGTWFQDVHLLARYAESSQYLGHKQRKTGMNYVEGVVKGKMSELGIEEQYRILLDKITL
ncbi:thioredoxin-like protein [Metschnikowia bicuspidata var. bicuspidata NRRL YB-4993]|uniref:Thioredoxin-like protein n=1 Tax=Metschnikowia bicuspidata var. bicuspidata NRRL YB-4993 TaxID=869754 RepID=A0A1A0HEA8_9ASCO|nr:thioredoxin-like protein [Metschnikowia bicuspidata var. bicuspidata NRRL YB-4993]OBA22238.1 thioredoxin-like protein [Metschnikowia bicuspidata var. bicuspidata NRRL YB-4993]